jgi:hypothetical protein
VGLPISLLIISRLGEACDNTCDWDVIDLEHVVRNVEIELDFELVSWELAICATRQVQKHNEDHDILTILFEIWGIRFPNLAANNLPQPYKLCSKETTSSNGDLSQDDVFESCVGHFPPV